MSESDAVRPGAVVADLRGGNSPALSAGATAEQTTAATDRYLSELVAERRLRDRQTKAWELLMISSSDEPPTWQQLGNCRSCRVRPGGRGPGRRPAGWRAHEAGAPLRSPVGGLSDR